MIKFTICFIKQRNRILLLNREFPSWMGCWNGVGGKLEANESPRESIIREIMEETQISEFKLLFKGIMTWKVDSSNFGGMYAYLAEIPDDIDYITPIKTREGILDWEEYDWIRANVDSLLTFSLLSIC